MFRPGGYGIAFGENGIQETDTFTCFHCNRVVFVKPKCDPYELGGMCKICTKMICPSCVDKDICDPFEEKLKRAEAAYEARRSYGV